MWSEFFNIFTVFRALSLTWKQGVVVVVVAWSMEMMEVKLKRKLPKCSSATIFDARGKSMAWCVWKVWAAVFKGGSLISSSGVHVIALGFTDKFLLLDSPVLEPDGHLTLWEVGGGRDAPSLVFGDELAGCIFFLQLLQLDLGVRDTFFTPTAVAADLRLQWHNVCKEKKGKCQENVRHVRNVSLCKISCKKNGFLNQCLD